MLWPVLTSLSMKLLYTKIPSISITPSPLLKIGIPPYVKNTPYFCHTIKQLLWSVAVRGALLAFGLLCWLLLCYGIAR